MKPVLNKKNGVHEPRTVETGLERLLKDPPSHLRRASLGLVANQASVGPKLNHAIQLIDQALPGRLKTIFSPQHGFAGEKQDNMVESDHGRESSTGRMIFSLYGRTRRPEPEMLANLDVLIIDLADVGTRVYTFAQTMTYCLEEAARTGLKVMVLDRPNPIGGIQVEGNLLKPDCASFVGLSPLPMRHGLTMGELAGYIARRLNPAPDFEVVRLAGWSREMYYDQTGLYWVMPSPNMPASGTALVYPGQVIWEGTNISEGRGTTRPFHLCGAPFIDSKQFKAELEGYDLPGVYFRAAAFEPTFHKYRAEVCHGLEVHPADRLRYQPYLTSLTMLEVLLRLYPDQVAWKAPPYEYERERCPLDLILGDRRIREGLEKGMSAADLAREWQPELSSFLEERKKYLLY
ncbi:MAG: DUF1343 domain-containing protein [Deltaproteobacteria bacterium]|nr:DUF1343 domain-containing protein [Deltaproteobacteria bacterium]